MAKTEIYYRITVPEKEYRLIERAVEVLMRLKMGQLEKVMHEEMEYRGDEFKHRIKKARKSLRKAQVDINRVMNEMDSVMHVHAPQLHPSVIDVFELLKKLNGLPDNQKNIEMEKDIEEEQAKINEDTEKGVSDED